MKLRIFLTVLVALAVLGGIFGYKALKNRQAQAALAARKPAPSTIITAVALAEKWRNTLHAVGTLQSFQGITVRSEIEGRITKVAFESGARVKAGDVLLEMDTIAEVAQLASAEASAKLTSANLERARELQKNNTNTKAELDAAEASAAQATAQIENLKSTLAKKRIVAPFDGRVGIRLVNLGQFLNKADAVVTLEAIDTMYADFSLPQQDISALKPGLTVNVNVDAFPGRVFAGKIEAIDPRINETTRNVRVRAVLPNKDEALRAGMFARVDVVLPEERELVVLPATAIVYSPYGDSVYVVVVDKEKNAQIAQQRFVTVGPKRGDLVSLTKGVKAGEEVVTGGQGKLRPGSLVKVNNTVVPANSATPKPSES
ncbi:efflux RND transporter periplasmic adaptor subunit [Oleiharenicola lentus]|uniref:efflux RND transporter periplasmic adaptor subunit n=1 Tax=Oleiharenicola lentus TaxID=2508720 RepID=UPI003F663782